MLIVTPYAHVGRLLHRYDPTHVVSILGGSDRLDWPDAGGRPTLRLRFDDVQYTSGEWKAPTRQNVLALIEFARIWGGSGTMLLHCRAGSSRSPAAAMITAAALGPPGLDSLLTRIASAKSYYRPHQGMLRLADSILSTGPRLVEIAGAVPRPDRLDSVGPERIPL